MSECKGHNSSWSNFCYVGDNTDVLMLNSALSVATGYDLAYKCAELLVSGDLNRRLALLTISQLSSPLLAKSRRGLSDLMADVQRESPWPSISRVKGTTGTQASFLSLFDGRDEILDKLVTADGDELFVDHLWSNLFKKVDADILNSLHL